MKTWHTRSPRGPGGGPSDHEWRYEDGESYLIFADGPLDSLRTGICQRTRVLRDAGEDLRALGRGRPPRRR